MSSRLVPAFKPARRIGLCSLLGLALVCLTRLGQAVETSTNLTSWSPLTSLTMDAAGGALFLDSTAGNRPRGFYRVRSPE